MVGRGAPEPKRSWRAGKTLLARQAHRSENPLLQLWGASINFRYNIVYKQCETIYKNFHKFKKID